MFDQILSMIGEMERDDRQTLYMRFMATVKEAEQVMWNGFTRHLVDGHDQFDFNSVGGFARSELLLIAEAATEVGLDAEVLEAPEQLTGVTQATMRRDCIGRGEISFDEEASMYDCVERVSGSTGPTFM